MNGNVIIISPDALSDLVAKAVRAGVKDALADAARSKNEHLREADAASYLGVAANTLRMWRSQGRGPAYRKLGKAVTYARAELDAWAVHNRTLTSDCLEARRGTPC